MTPLGHEWIHATTLRSVQLVNVPRMSKLQMPRLFSVSVLPFMNYPECKGEINRRVSLCRLLTPLVTHSLILHSTYLPSPNQNSITTHSFIQPHAYAIIQPIRNYTHKMLASILFALLPLVSAMVTPTTPDGSTVINEGGSIDAAWTADDTGSWTNMTIQLMTGDNLAVSSGHDGHGH